MKNPLLNQTIIHLKSISHSFGYQSVLKKINLQIQKSETFVLVGGSGQGKTTLLKIMAGLIEPNHGDVFIKENNFYKLNFNDRLPLLKKMSMLFQKNALFDSLSCLENVAFPLLHGSQKPKKEIYERAHFFLDSVGLSHVSNLFPDEISGGMQKRLGIARALILEPEIVFYDDPTAGLDPITSRKIIELIQNLKEKNNSTVVVITNDMNRAYQLDGTMGLLDQEELLIAKNKTEIFNLKDSRFSSFVNGVLNEAPHD